MWTKKKKKEKKRKKKTEKKRKEKHLPIKEKFQGFCQHNLPACWAFIFTSSEGYLSLFLNTCS